MKRIKRLLAQMGGLSLCSALLAACAAGGGNGALIKQASLPVTLENNIPLVTVEINGKPLRLGLDTGAQRTVIVPKVAQQLGLLSVPHVIAVAQGFGGEVEEYVSNVSVTVGRTDAGRHQVLLMDLPYRREGRLAIDGVLGADILSRYDIDLDLPDRKVVLYQKRDWAGAVPPWKVPFTECDFPATLGNEVLLPVEIDGHRVTAELDTGAQTSLISEETAERIGVTAGMLDTDRAFTAEGVDLRPVPIYLHRFATVRIAGQSFRDIALPVGATVMADMLLGTDYLRYHRVWIAFTMGKLCIAAPEAHPLLPTVIAKDSVP